MFKNLESLRDVDELLSTLSCINIAVPYKSENGFQENAYVEVWVICRLLSTLATDNDLVFPVTLRKRESPDFFLLKGNSEIGIEVTRAVLEQYAQYSELASKDFPNSSRDSGLFRLNSPNLDIRDMKIALEINQLSSPPMVGHMAEVEWARSIMNTIKKKFDKLQELNFQKFEVNWLAIYNGLPNQYIDFTMAIGLLRPMLEDTWESQFSFNAIYIEHGEIIAKLTKQSVTYMKLNNLWK